MEKMRTKTTSITRYIAKHIGLLLLLVFMHNTWAYIPSANSVYGSVYTRGVVLDDNGNSTYVAYNEDGTELETIAVVNTDALRTAQVIGTAQANAIVEHYQTLLNDFPDAEVKTRAEYDALATPPNRPALVSYNNFVVVRGEAQRQLMVDGSQLILQQSVIDPQKQYSGTSLLVSREGNILASSEGNIGLRASFLKDENNEAVYDIGSSSFNYWRNNGYSLVSPLTNLPVSTGEWITGTRRTVTNHEGRYSMRYYMFCPGFQHEWTIPVNVELKYSRFNPRGKVWAPYFFTSYKYDFCSGLSALLENSTNLTGQMAYLNVLATELFLATPIVHRDVPIDVIILDGAASFVNVGLSQDKTRYDDSKSSLTRTAQEAKDFDKDGTLDKVETGKIVTTQNAEGEQEKAFEAVPVDQSPELQGVWLSSEHDLTTLDITQTLPSYTRLLDWSDDFQDRALLSEIKETDLQNTDIYLIRESDGTLITERRGIKDDEYGSVGNLSTWDGEFKYTMQIVNKYEARNRYGYTSYTGFRRYGPNREKGFEAWQAAGNMDPKFYERNSDHLRIGEVVRIVAINRATGYMGTRRTRVKAAGDEGVSQLLSFYIPKIIMRPPNLKVWAKRSSEVGVESRGEKGIQAIGNEGAALSDDKSIIISTEWLDHDGSPLPAALDDYGFTGRLARVSAPNTLTAKQGAAAGGSSLSNFPIKPGRQTQVIKLAEANLGTEYLYVHVSGEPQKRRSDLSSGLTEDFSGNFNNDPSIYPEGSILKYRPAKFVPVKVSVFDEKGTQQRLESWEIAQQTNPALEKPEPYYRWLYRPEYQFSVYDLELDQIIRTPDQGEPIDIYISSDPTISATDDTLRLLYNLTESAFDALDAYSYPDDRELVFSLAGQEIRATIGNNQQITFDNLDYLAALQAEDLLTITLFSNNDAANVLWEYDFTPITINIAADFNRDGEIVFPEDDKLNDKEGKRTDLVTEEKPYVFWINDDADDKDSEVKGKDITVTGGFFGKDPNHKNDFIDGSRDLIDFFAVAIDLHDLLNRDGAEEYKIALRHKDNAVNVVYTAMDINNSDEYLNELKVDNLGPTFFGKAQTINGLKSIPMSKIQSGKEADNNIPTWFTELIKEDKNKGVILVEINKLTEKPLELVVYKEGDEVMSKELPLRVVNIEDFYLQVNLRGPQSSLVHEIPGVSIAAEENSTLWGDSNSPPSLAGLYQTWLTRKQALQGKLPDTTNLLNNFILVHGFNVSEDSGKEFMNETYKRLYHSGSNAVFTGVHWNGNQGMITALNYWRNNENAFYTADDLTSFINSISGRKSVAAHSMGNTVLGSAISDFGLNIDDYFMIDPAVPLEAYDPAQLNPAEMRHTDWDNFYFGQELEQGNSATYNDAGGRRLWSTEWYNLFPSNDERSKLTWRGRFNSILSQANVVQYFSTGEEVLQQSDEGVPWSLGQPVFSDAGRNSWNVSEKAKGNRQLAGSLFIGDSGAGWEFRELTTSEILINYKLACTAYKLSYPSKVCSTSLFSQEDAMALTDEELKIDPFFKHFTDGSILDPISGSQRAEKANAHALAYDIPSLSFAAGGTKIDKPRTLAEKQKVDMNGEFVTNGWPQAHYHKNKPAWFHSDFKDVAYLYTFGLFDSMVGRGNLK